MNKIGAKVEYIEHSGFKIEIEDKILLFDYFKGDINLDSNKKIYVFASHSHGDHFNPVVLDWKNDFKDIHYIFSDDIKVDDSTINFIGVYKELVIDNLNIKTFGSTDMGVSFLININDINIFHAGDLNWWYWDDDTEVEKINMEKSFKKKIERIKDLNIDMDLAFFPVDPRLEDYFHIGGEYFIKELNPKYFFPMHAWDKYDTSQKFIHKISNYSTMVVDIKHKNQIFCL